MTFFFTFLMLSLAFNRIRVDNVSSSFCGRKSMEDSLQEDKSNRVRIKIQSVLSFFFKDLIFSAQLFCHYF